MTPVSAITGIILAGGKSSRMGAEKALMKLDNREMIAWPLALLKKFCSQILISANSSNFDHLQLEVVPDVYPNCGPMAGLHACMLASSADDFLVISCDMPFVNETIIKQLLSLYPLNQAVIASYKEETIPVCAYYHRSVLPLLEQELEAGLLKMKRFIDKTDHAFVHFNNPELILRLSNINTPEEYEQALKLLHMLEIKTDE
ncbi:MAG: hypothetical protein CVT92_09995 [Bacteroidetes bacterium HGW-Bacteroidetes-1]|jgi:molybdopterin-guanine dinucleotide biosynthesis protein A|nr:MAG: hypothetical protein CVT92_09995 [Bacteroidetes bacterium HGW-Bacteroidetes-1]